MTDVSKWDNINTKAFIACLQEARKHFEWLDPYHFLRFTADGVATEAANEYIVKLVNRELCDKSCVANGHSDMQAKLAFKNNPDGSRTYKMIYYAGHHAQHEYETWLAAVKLHQIELQETQDKIKQLQEELPMNQHALDTAQVCAREVRDLLDNHNYDTLYLQFMSED